MNAVDRLTELLDERDSTIRQLEAKIERFEQDNDSKMWEWARHRRVEDEMDLPVPRLEMRWHKVDDWHWEWRYGLVYRFFDGECINVPMGFTRCSGTWKPRPGDLIREMPFRDGAHIIHDMRQLNLPAFVVVDECAQRIPPSLTPQERP